MKTSMKLLKNDEAVSPIVATLVLIVVAIIGAAAVGLIMGSFSSNVANQANSGNTAAQASTVISVAGSTSMQPVINTLATWYGNNNTGVKVNVAPGGSGVGYMSIEKGMADIGMISEGISSAQLAAYPNLKAYQVGASGVVFVVSPGTLLTTETTANLKADFQGAPVAPITASCGRSDVSGTQDTAMAYLGLTSSTWNPTTSKSGNGGIRDYVAANNNVVGILDSDYAVASSTPVKMLGVDAFAPTAATAGDNILNQIKNGYTGAKATWPAGLIRPLNLITMGPASATADSFINFCQAPTASNQAVFAGAYQVHVSQVAPAYLV